jgi:hypothetical protein
MFIIFFISFNFSSALLIFERACVWWPSLRFVRLIKVPFSLGWWWFRLSNLIVYKKLNNKNIGYSILRVLLGILYSLNSFQIHTNVRIIYLNHYYTNTWKNLNINLIYHLKTCKFEQLLHLLWVWTLRLNPKMTTHIKNMNYNIVPHMDTTS